MYICRLKLKVYIMTKATIQSVRQTEKAGLFTICFEGESFTELQKFIVKGNENATLQPDLQKILNAIEEATLSGVDDKQFEI